MSRSHRINLWVESSWIYNKCKIYNLPQSGVTDTVYQEKGVTDRDSVVYGISTTTGGSYHVPHQGWVGVTTYVDMHGNLRVKSEVLVAMSGITTTKDSINSTPSIPYPTTDRNS